MPEFIPDLLKYSAGFATAWIIHILSSRRESRNRIRKAKDEFFGVLASQKSGLDSLSREQHKHFNPNEDKFFRESVEAMTAACYRVEKFVTAVEWTRLRGVLAEYQAHKEQYSGLTRSSLDYKSGESFVKRLAKFMDRFDKCIAK